MLGRDHTLSGALAFGVAAPLLHLNGISLTVGVILTAGAGLVNDIDEHGSTIAREGGFLTEGLAYVVHHLGGGHRKLTHSILGVAIFTGAAQVGVAYQHSIYAMLGLGLCMAVMGAAAIHLIRRGGHFGDAVAILAAVAIIVGHVDLSIVPLCFAMGMAAHIAGDMCTHDGCPLLYPFSKYDYALLPHEIRITTGKLAETWIVTPVLLLSLAYALWRDSSTLAPMHIHQLAQHINH